VTKVATPVVTQVQSTVSKTVAPVAKVATPVVTQVQSTVSKTVAPVAKVATPVVTQVQSTVSKTVAPVAKLATPVVTQVQSTVSKTVAPVASTVSKVVTPLATTLNSVVTNSVASLPSPVSHVVTPGLARVTTSVLPAALGAASASRGNGSTNVRTTSARPPAGPTAVPAGSGRLQSTRPVTTAAPAGSGLQSTRYETTVPAGTGPLTPVELPVAGFPNGFHPPAAWGSAGGVAPGRDWAQATFTSSAVGSALAGEGLDRRNDGAASAPSPANPSAAPLNTGSFGTGGRAATGGFGLFFFGAAALLALAVELLLGASSPLRATARRTMPQPFISLLERPG